MVLGKLTYCQKYASTKCLFTPRIHRTGIFLPTFTIQKKATIYECTVTILQLFSGTDFLRGINVSDSSFVCQGKPRPKAVSGVPSSSGFHAL